MRRLIREPLVHFLLLGAGLFAVFGILNKGAGGGEPGKIVVTLGKTENLATLFSRTWQRPPTPQELEGLIQDYVREEVAVREALALGLDRDDIIIRRRLRQKLEFVSEDLAGQVEPTDEELRAYLKEHPDTFRIERRFTFTQIYLNPERRGETLARDASELLAKLKQAGSKTDLSGLGDSFLLEQRFDAAPASDVVKLFGEKFTGRLNELPVGEWAGPVESGYGTHLVWVSERTEGRLPELEEVRDRVRREWANAEREKANEKFYQALLGRYTVTIEKPQE
jgi:hypothetical protein